MKQEPAIQVSPPCGPSDGQWLTTLWHSEWMGETMVSRGHIYHLQDLMALVAKIDEKPVGAATYRLNDAGGCELLSINAAVAGVGVGTRLLEAVEEDCRRLGCGRVWLITSNDNLEALRFYQRRGYRIIAVYPGAIDEARQTKPTIPVIGNFGIGVHDEIELEKVL